MTASLWQLAAETSEAALRSGALLPIGTSPTLVREAGVEFVVRVVDGRARTLALGVPAAPSAPNPFLPPDPALVVAPVLDSHWALLNKYPVLPNHLLLVTRCFEDQTCPLTLADFRAAWECLDSRDSLVFYNSGTVAGASQRHKHLQVMPLPLTSTGPRFPTEPLLHPLVSEGRVFRAPRLPFVHALSRLEAEHDAQKAIASFDAYRELLDCLELVGPIRGLQPRPYNLLMTREWLLVIPRTRDCCENFSVNALGFAGTLLVNDTEARQKLLERGPMQVLCRVGLMPDGRALRQGSSEARDPRTQPSREETPKAVAE